MTKKEKKTHEPVQAKEERTPEKTQNEQYEEKIADLTNTLQRLQAEFENYKKRIAAECADFQRLAEEDLIRQLLPVLDSFELALKNKSSAEEFIKGTELIYSQLFQMLEDRGLKVIETSGKKFSPYEHEALLTEESEKEENTVLEELQKGYVLQGKVIRHAKVKVSKKKQS